MTLYNSMTKWPHLLLLVAVLQGLATGHRFPTARIRNPIQVILEDNHSRNYTITLDGSVSTGADSFEWEEHRRPRYASASKIENRLDAVTNVTIDAQQGVYRFKLSAKSTGRRKRPRTSTASSVVHVESASSVGMYILSSDIVTRLLQMQYQYLGLSQHYKSALRYYPNVSEYFRKLAKTRGAMLDEVTKYILAKQVTEELLQSCPTDFVRIMMSDGFNKSIVYNNDVTELMTSAFVVARTSEAELGGKLAEISLYAEKNNDFELSEFVAADLLPRVTKTLHEHTNHLRTTLRATEASPQRHLAEFLFDKYLFM
uniref:uncharacterized protein LOC120343150 n=1 Tax=Styela clava TaxID=7725 RepID=UPI001939A312|nr:uncharacterized protein LOC120343150 [Styela clava]